MTKPKPKAPPGFDALPKVGGTFSMIYTCLNCGHSFSRQYPFGQLVIPVIECPACVGMYAVRRSKSVEVSSWTNVLAQGTSTNIILPLEPKP